MVGWEDLCKQVGEMLTGSVGRFLASLQTPSGEAPLPSAAMAKA